MRARLLGKDVERIPSPTGCQNEAAPEPRARVMSSIV